jgi:hypothetical protein
MRPIYYIIGYQGDNQILTPLVKARFIHNWVIMGIQWMDDVLVGAGSIL